MKYMNQAKKFVAVTVPAALLAAQAHAGPAAEAVKAATTDFKSDLSAVGTETVGVALVGIAFILALRLFKRGV